MPRPKLIRRMTNPPHFRGFKPIGISGDTIPVILNYEEYEAIRLSDFELHGQAQAARIMGISRPTYTRIYESARRKIAQAFVKGQAIVFEGGKVYFDSEWFSCNACGCWFNHLAKEEPIKNCGLCGSDDILQYHGNIQPDDFKDVCICPKCGAEKKHIHGVPCKTVICSSCQCSMIRKEAGEHNTGKINNC